MANSKRCERLIHQAREIAGDLSGVPQETITEHATFLELGFDSLFLTQLSAACQKAFGLRITFRQLFSDLPTIAALGAYVDEKLPAEALPEPAETMGDRPVDIAKLPASVAVTPAPTPAPVQTLAPNPAAIAVQAQSMLDAVTTFIPQTAGEDSAG